MSPEMTNTFDLVVNTINKKYGKGTLQSFADKVVVDPDSINSTGSIGLDIALGIGGYKKGRIIEVIGMPSSGKTTLCLHAIANIQAKGGRGVVVDVEHSFDPLYASNIGCNMDNLLISQPDCAEDALEIVNTLVKSGEVDLIILDSVAALVARSELEGEIGDQTIGKQARLMSQAMRMIVGNANKTGCTVIFTNQWRANIGGFGHAPSKIQSGGNALKYYASIRVEVVSIGQEKEGDKVIGNKTKAKVIKNKLAPPFREADFMIKFGIGIHKDQEILDLALEDDLIKKSGSWYKYNDESIAQGKIRAVEWLNENLEIKEEFTKTILANRGLV